MRKRWHQIACVLACALSACASAPGPKPQVYVEDGKLVHFDPEKDPYWQDPPWTASLFKAVQSVVHDPVDAADTSTPGLHATVKFTYANGVIEYPDIVKSTGHPDLDKLMLRQIASVQPPQATGPQADEIHEFIMELDMLTPLETFQSTVYAAISNWRVYPRQGVIDGAMGNTTVGFDYLDGKAIDIVMTGSAKDKYLDKSSLDTVTRAVMPPAPPIYAGKTLHMEAIFCYSLRESANAKDPCPAGRNVIEVTGTRIRR